jgi:hypothetical protein
LYWLLSTSIREIDNFGSIILLFIFVMWYSAIDVAEHGFSCTRENEKPRIYLQHTLSTTTVIMKTLESEDEGVCGAHDVDNGFDEPRTASSVGMLTRVTAVQANAQVFDALLHRVTGGGHAHQRLERGLGRGVGQVIRQLVRRAL